MSRQQAPGRIAIVFRGIGDIGGTNNTIADHALGFRSLGYGVDLIGEKISKGGVSPAMGRAIAIRRLPLVGRYKWRWFAARADRVIEKNAYRFVAGHGHHFRQNVLSMHNCLHRAHEEVYGTALDVRCGLAEIHDRIMRGQHFEYCICNSRLMQIDLSQRYGIAVDRLPVVYPAYRPEQFGQEDREKYRAPVREELGCSDDILLLGLVTSGDYVKRGLDILLAAYASLDADRRNQTELLVLGKQAGNRAFIERARALGIAGRMHFVAHTRQPQRYLHALDLCIHPARFEEFGQSVQEAMVCGVPVLTNRQVGASELLPDDLRAQLPERPDADRLTADMARMIDSASLRAGWAKRAADAVRDNTVQANWAKTLEIYHRAGLPESGDFAER